jgi:phosphohistidine phosphatase
MKLYLVQHGAAKSEAEDPERGLTVSGEEEIKKVASMAKRMGLNPSNIFHSVKLRAQQTARIIGEALGRPVEVAQGLAPMDDIQSWVDKINLGEMELMLVGHLPFLEKLASYLMTGDENIRPLLFRFGAINHFERKEDLKWAVRWVLTPEMAAIEK